MQDYNFHTHTYLCGHAKGKAEEYVLKAIEGGFKSIGFSEHMCYPNWDDPKERVFYGHEDEYIDEINRLKTKYQDQINIYVGFEFEYFDDCVEHIKTMRDKVDYLICGQHALDRQEHYYDSEEYCQDKYIEIMSKQVEKAFDLGLTKYLAHPDYFLLSKKDFNKSMQESVLRMAKAVKRNDGFMEINLKGMKYGKREYQNHLSYFYPNYEVFKIIAEVGCKVVIGYDAHYPDSLIERNRENLIKDEFKTLNLNLYNHLTIDDLNGKK